MSIRVRFAPSPTGPLHIGGARTALYNWLLARGQGGTFILRIDDTDAARSTQESLRHIFEGLTWLGIDWDEGPGKEGGCGPYFQSQKYERYREAGRKLLASGHAYRCFCTEEEIEKGRNALVAAGGKPMYDRRCRKIARPESDRRAAAGDPFALRYAIPEGVMVVDDMVKGRVEVNLAELDDWVMLRKDGSPLYNFCSTIDDADMAITHVIRGEEHFYNGIKQLLLFQALQVPAPRFAHLPLILGKDRKKLSKRLAQTNLLDYRDQGYPPEAIVNFICLLGWAWDGKTEIFTRKELIERFSLERISTGGSMFDEEKLLWMAGMYLRAMTKDQFLDGAIPQLVKAGVASEATIAAHRAFFRNLAACEQERISFFQELPPRVAYVFADRFELDEGARKNLEKEANTRELVAQCRELLASLRLPPSFPADRLGVDDKVTLPANANNAPADAASLPFLAPQAIEKATRELAEKLGVKFGALVHPLRALLTGTTKGPGLFDIVYLLGREKVLARLSG